MEVNKDYVAINLSKAQRKIVQDPIHFHLFDGLLLGDWDRPRVPMNAIDALMNNLEGLKPLIVQNPEYSTGRPDTVIDQILLRLKDAKSAHQRTFPS